jgi:hypothetical protein
MFFVVTGRRRLVLRNFAVQKISGGFTPAKRQRKMNLILQPQALEIRSRPHQVARLSSDQLCSDELLPILTTSHNLVKSTLYAKSGHDETLFERPDNWLSQRNRIRCCRQDGDSAVRPTLSRYMAVYSVIPFGHA